MAQYDIDQFSYAEYIDEAMEELADKGIFQQNIFRHFFFIQY